LNAICEFPTINSNFRNVFLVNKKSRPAAPPDSYLSKCYIINDNLFDFGPLLINKDPEKRNTDETIKNMNSCVFRITNNGKYDLQGAFTLRSTLPVEEGGTGEKSPFILDPDNMDLKIDETKNLTVYAFPDKA
jgi:hydrocephalus-inducing protein